jgi:hypothetical protein
VLGFATRDVSDAFYEKVGDYSGLTLSKNYSHFLVH